MMVAINFNIDMGDSWEHADDPRYPVPMTALGYKLEAANGEVKKEIRGQAPDLEKNHEALQQNSWRLH